MVNNVRADKDLKIHGTNLKAKDEGKYLPDVYKRQIYQFMMDNKKLVKVELANFYNYPCDILNLVQEYN